MLKCNPLHWSKATSAAAAMEAAALAAAARAAAARAAAIVEEVTKFSCRVPFGCY